MSRKLRAIEIPENILGFWLSIWTIISLITFNETKISTKD
jgi:hypothetical protein